MLLLSGLGQGGRGVWEGEGGGGRGVTLLSLFFFLSRESLGPWAPSGAEGELVLLDGLFDPGPQAGLVEGLDERLLGRVVLCGRLLGVVVRARLQHLDPQDGRQLKTKGRGWMRSDQSTFRVNSVRTGSDWVVVSHVLAFMLMFLVAIDKMVLGKQS